MVRAPSIHAMNQEVFLYPELITECYYFMMAMGTDMKVLDDNVTPPQIYGTPKIGVPYFYYNDY